MRYKLFGLVSMAVMLAVSITAVSVGSDNQNVRIEQHVSARQPYEGCGCDQSELCTHLPLVVINTGGSEMPGEPIVSTVGSEVIVEYTKTENGESMLKADISIMDNPDKNHHPSDEPDISSSVLIRIRGNSSRFFDKKNYLIRFIDDSGKYENHEVMGMESHYEWALHGPFLDKSLIRNYMWYNISGKIMDYSPNVRFCEVILNGEYIGLYVMTETLTNGDGSRLNISEPVSGTTNTGYLLRVDTGSANDLKNIEPFSKYTYKLKNPNMYVDIQYPRAGDLTEEMADAITSDFSDFEKALYSYDHDTLKYGYWNNIDVQSFVDYFIINEFTSNYDVGTRSTYIYKDIGGKYKMAVWDFNSACDNYQDLSLSSGMLWVNFNEFDNEADIFSFKNSAINAYYFELQNIVWYFMLMKDESFTESIIDRYRELRKTYLSEEYLYKYIDDTVAYLGDAVDRNFEVWGYTFDEEFDYQLLYPPERNLRSFDEAIEQLKYYIHERGLWMDENIEILRQYSHDSKNKKFNH